MKATAEARANIAFVKYWGRADDRLNLPLNDSISLTLDKLRTTTTVEFSPALRADELTLNGQRADDKATARASRHLDRVRALAKSNDRARVVSVNEFTTAGGLASSASGFAALSVAGAAALGLRLTPVELSRVARLGSGSACRSLFGGYVKWRAGTDDATSVAEPLHAADWWDLRDVVVTVEAREKKVGSSDGHSLASSSPLMPARIASMPETLARVERALATRDLALLGETIEREALNMHAVMMTSTPSLLYWTPETVRVLHAARAWREAGLPAYVTLDAGPNPHVITEARHVPRLVRELGEMGYAGEKVLVCAPGEGPRVLSTHLF